jgi:hypothetical protein
VKPITTQSPLPGDTTDLNCHYYQGCLWLRHGISPVNLSEQERETRREVVRCVPSLVALPWGRRFKVTCFSYHICIQATAFWRHESREIISNMFGTPTMQTVEAGNRCGGGQGASQMREGQVRFVNDTVSHRNMGSAYVQCTD